MSGASARMAARLGSAGTVCCMGPLQHSSAQGSVSSSGGWFPKSECPKGPRAASEASDDQPRKCQNSTLSVRQITRPAQHPGERGPVSPLRGRGSKGLVAL